MVVTGDVGSAEVRKEAEKKEVTKSQKEEKRGVIKYPVTKTGFMYYGAGGDAVVDYDDL